MGGTVTASFCSFRWTGKKVHLKGIAIVTGYGGVKHAKFHLDWFKGMVWAPDFLPRDAAMLARSWES